jgi:hypothetical protein
MKSWLIPFGVSLVWFILVAPLVGIPVAGLSGFVLAVVWELIWFIRDAIDIWRYPYRDRGESDLWKYL